MPARAVFRLVVQLVTQRDEQGRLGDRREVLDVEVDERLRGLVVGVLGVVHVDEQRAGQRRVLACLGRLGGGLDAAVSVVDRQRLQRVRILLVVRVAEVAGRTLGARDTLHQDVVVLGCLVVVAGRLRLVADHVSGHVVVSAGVGARTEQADLLVGEARVELAPVVDRRAGRPQLDELVGGEAVDREVGVHDHGQRVGGDLELGVLDAGVRADRRFLVLLDRTGGVGDVGLAGAEALEPATGAGLTNGHLDLGCLFAEQLGRRSGHRVDGGRPIDQHVAGDVAAVACRHRCPSASLPHPEHECRSRRCRARSPGEWKCSSLRSPVSSGDA